MIKLADDLSSGDHVCAIPDSEEHLSELAAQFVAGGIRRGEKVLCFDDDLGAAGAVLRRLDEDGADVREPLRIGQLQIISAELARAAFRAPVAEIVRNVVDTVDTALAEGYRGCRVTGQTHAAATSGSATLPELDGALHRVVGQKKLTALCTYDPMFFTDEQIDIMRSLHRDHLAPTGAYDDGLMRIVRTGTASARLAGEIDHSNRPKITTLLRSSLDRSLRSPDAAPEVVLDMASVRFVDVATAVSLVHAAEMFPATHSLVLNRVRPRVQRILDRCGAPFADRLVTTDESGDLR